MFKVFKTSGIEGNYSISSYPLFVNNNCWSVYPAKHKTTKKLYSVWQFHKKECETRLINEGVINKNNKSMVMNDIIENIRNFIGNQTKFKHPNFITVIEPLEDHKNRVLFVTENVINDLSNVTLADLDEIMIMKGLLQVCNGMKFLHESVNSVHLNLKPASILITESYDWKISGLTFLESITNGVIEKYVDPMSSMMPQFMSIDFRFTSPNLLINHKVDFVNDLFSICCLVYFLFNDGGYLLDCPPSSSTADYERQIKKLNHVLKNVNSGVKHATFQKIPDNFYSTFLDVLNNCQESNTDVIQLKKNYSINDLINSQMFNNDLIKTLNILDDYNSFATHERINFLKSLKEQIQRFPVPLLLNKFIPILTSSIDISQYKKNNQPSSEDEELIVEVCENMIILSQSLSRLTFSDKIFPLIATILKKLPFDNFKILLLKHLNIFESGLKSSSEAFQKFSLDLFLKSINEKNSMAVQELVLTNVKIILESQSYSIITSTIIPELCTLYSTTTSLKIKTLTIYTFNILVSQLENKNIDDLLIVDKILPLIYKTSTSVYTNSKFTSSILKLYDIIFQKLSKSKSKAFSVGGQETEMYDLIMDLGFNVWKIAKFVSNSSDLKAVYALWTAIEKYLKKELELRVGEGKPNEAFTPVVNENQFKPVAREPVTTDFAGMNGFEPMKPKNDVMHNSVIKPTVSGNTTGNSEVFGVMKPNNNTHHNIAVMTPQNSNSKANGLGFGQTVQKPNVTKTESNSTIDWSRANSNLNVMQPTTQNAKTTNYMSSMTPMAPTSSLSKPVTKADEDDDEWGDFGVGSTTTKDWGDSLI